MTDEPDGTPLSPEEEAEVRRLLADAGGPAPTPPDVVARLDDVLAGLVAERAGTDSEAAAVVTPLGSRRRRWPTALLAAAAVVVGGYGLGTVVNRSMSGSDDAGSAAGGMADSADAQAEDSGSGTDDLAALPRDGEMDSGARRISLSSDDFDADVRRALGPQELAGQSADSSNGATQSERKARKAEAYAMRKALGRCAEPPSSTRDRWFVVRYDGKVATLVVTPPRQGAVVAQVFSCDGTTLLRDSTVELD